MKQLISNRNLYLKIEGYSRRIDRLLTENPKAKGKHEKNHKLEEKKSCFGEFRLLNDLLVNNHQKSNC